MPEIGLERPDRLRDLIHSFKIRSEMAAKLLEDTTPEPQRKTILATLMAMRVDVGEGRQKIARLSERSNDLIRRSAALVTRAQKEIDKTAYLYTGYVTRQCGLCKGVIEVSDGPCQVCKGSGTVVVKEPAILCLRCEGNGKTRANDRALRYSSICVRCDGRGWITNG